jgi:hypothetical protein
MRSRAKRALRPSWLMRLASSALTLASLLLVGGWLYTRRQELAAIQWSAQWRVFLLLVGMYGLSLMVNFIVWHSCLRSIMAITWSKDLELYAYSNLSRRLPSGLGYLFVRAVRYRTEDLGPAMVLYFSAQELLLQVITGVLVAFLVSSSTVTINWVTGALAISLAIPIVFVLRPSVLSGLLDKLSRNSSPLPVQISRRSVLGWLVAYTLTWLNGGLMLHILLVNMVGTSVVPLRQTLGSWSFAASLGLLGSLVPLGQFARDAALSLLLQSYMPLSIAAAVALAFRLILTIGDIVWSLILWGIGRAITQKKYCE